MDPPLEDKIAFFKQLDVFSGQDPDEEEVEKEVVRKKAKTFVAAAGPRASASARLSKRIKDTPEASCRPPYLRGTGSDTHGVSTSIIVETPAARRPQAQPVAPPSRPFSSLAPAVETRSGGKMPKRKRDSEMQLVSPAKRYFQDLRFFYVPDNDINPTRKFRIRRAREHGAEWTRAPSQATHVIVDKGLSRADVETALGPTPATGPRIIVDETYPTHCILHGHLLSADQKKYQIGSADDKTPTSPARADTSPPPSPPPPSPPPRVDRASPSAARGPRPE